MSKKYFLGGAYWDGLDLTNLFVNRGYWEMGWDLGVKPQFDKVIEQMEKGDRIAIKSNANNNELIIKAIGIIECLNPRNKKQVFVDWKLTDIERRVAFKGCMGTVYGPYKLEGEYEDWLKNIFIL